MYIFELSELAKLHDFRLLIKPTYSDDIYPDIKSSPSLHTMRADVQLILLASLSLIPNNTLRYTALGSIIALALVYNIHLNIATWLRQLERSIQQTEEFIEEVKSKCPWPGDQFKLAEERVRLLE
jgi:hypothetical protein